MVDSQPVEDREVRRIEVRDGGSAGLAVECHWAEDRFSHRILGVLAGEPAGTGQQVLLASGPAVVAGLPLPASEQWPADPPLQQVSVEPIGPGDAILAVGQAGCGHWSSSVEGTPGASTGNAGELASVKFDIACRFARPAGYLGSLYRIAAEGAVLEIEQNRALLALAGPLRGHRLQLTATRPATPGRGGTLPAAADDELAWQTDPAAQWLWLSAARSLETPLPQTVRWQFTAALISCDAPAGSGG
ncbi:hypothetical protein [Roseimaritima sediminicola]|uniref:hypothetical protein n=1 Tax=Roseimaritima sediminicola TaxID=2662066 RepID=UPI0012984C5B|nr:hypothetical protein [Roseimaritima sediminicola]